jgi:hypothetical protein
VEVSVERIRTTLFSLGWSLVPVLAVVFEAGRRWTP